MKEQLKIQLLKFCLVVLNSVFLVLGVSASGCGLWILFDSGSFLTAVSSVELHMVAVALLVIGGVVTVVSVTGCVGADGENRVLLLIYLGFLVVLVLAQVFVTLLLLINRNEIEVGLNAAVDHIVVQYTGRSAQDTLMDGVQRHGRCCGRTGPADWLKNSYINSLNLSAGHVLPCSCFTWCHGVDSSWCSQQLNATQPPFGRGNTSYDQGCEVALSDWLQENTLTIVGMDVSLMLIQVLQLAVAVDLYREFGRKSSLKGSSLIQSDPTGGLDGGDLRPDHRDNTDYHHDNQGMDSE